MACRAVYHPDDHDGANLYNKLFAAEAYVRRSAEPQRAFEAAKHRLEEAQARDRVKERKARTRRLIQEGAVFEKHFPAARHMELDELYNVLREIFP